jgi:hypothetical protein
VDRPKVNADRAIAERTNRQGEGKPDPLVCISTDPAHRLGRMHISRIEDARFVEHPEQPRC